MAFRAGVPCEKGDAHGGMQPPTLMFCLAGVDTGVVFSVSATGTGNVLIQDTATLHGSGRIAPTTGGTIIVEDGGTVAIGDLNELVAALTFSSIWFSISCRPIASGSKRFRNRCTGS